MPALQRVVSAVLMIFLVLGTGGALASCSGTEVEARPQSFISPVDGKPYCAWLEHPGECDGSGLAPAPFAMPYEEPDHDDGLSGTDMLLMMALFNYHSGAHSYYHNDRYYDRHIGPAWDRHPHSRHYAAPGRHSVKSDRGTFLNRTKSFETKYAAKIKTEESKMNYIDSKGKTYKGNDPKAREKLFTNSGPSSNNTHKSPGSGSTVKGPSNPGSVKSPSSGTSPRVSSPSVRSGK